MRLAHVILPTLFGSRQTHIYIQVKKKAFKINAIIEDVGLNEDLKSTETRNGH